MANSDSEKLPLFVVGWLGGLDLVTSRGAELSAAKAAIK